MLKKINKLNPHIRYGVLGNLYGMGIYFVIAVVVTLTRQTQTLSVGVETTVWGILLNEVLLLKYSLLIVFVTTGFFIIKQDRNILHNKIVALGSNLVFCILLFPIGIIILGVISYLLSLVVLMLTAAVSNPLNYKR